MTFGRASIEDRQATYAAERAARAKARAKRIRQQVQPSRSLHKGTMAGGTSARDPKTEPKRNPHLLAMARGMPCLLRVPGVCSGSRDATVACHSNLSIHGKAGARKADDQYTVWGCAACHEWLDRGNATAAQKEAVFMAGHVRQVEAWRGIDRHDPFIKDRNAARWALAELGAIPAAGHAERACAAIESVAP